MHALVEGTPQSNLSSQLIISVVHVNVCYVINDTFHCNLHQGVMKFLGHMKLTEQTVYTQ